MKKLILNFQFSIFIYWLLTANRWQLIMAFWRSRRAFRYIFASSAIASLAKDAAPIPNALETETEIGNGDGK